MRDSRRKVLYIDDENPNLLLFKLTFRNEFEVITASSGREGLRMLEEEPEISVVISDMRMPEMNGLEFISEARKNRKDVTYCLLTGYGNTEEIESAVESRIINYCFRKPFNREEIIDLVNNTERLS